MKTQICNLMGFYHRRCKEELHQYIQTKIDDDKKIKDLNTQLVQCLTQIQELKAINDYQAFDLQRKIETLEKELATLTSSKESHD